MIVQFLFNRQNCIFIKKKHLHGRFTESYKTFLGGLPFLIPLKITQILKIKCYGPVRISSKVLCYCLSNGFHCYLILWLAFIISLKVNNNNTRITSTDVALLSWMLILKRYLLTGIQFVLQSDTAYFSSSDWSTFDFLLTDVTNVL